MTLKGNINDNVQTKQKCSYIHVGICLQTSKPATCKVELGCAVVHTSGGVLQPDVSPSRQVEQLVDDLAVGTFVWIHS